MTTRAGACPACADGRLEGFLAVPGVPVLCNVLCPDEATAKGVARGDLVLGFCSSCGLIHNLAFDADRIDYTLAYENSLHFSPTFQRYAEHLAQRLAAEHDLRGATIVEVGCGSGDFLRLLCELADARGVGFDPSHDPRRAVASDRVTIQRAPYPTDRTLAADLVCSRHVLEHLADPAALLETVRHWIGDRPDVVSYIEVPDATYMLREGAIWDLIYEHCSYFAEPTLRRLFERSGFRVARSGTAFSDQFLWVEARPGGDGAAPENEDRLELARLADLVTGFAEAFARETARWDDRLARLDAGGPVAVWGAGTKGVMFLNMLDGAEQVGQVVDVNPRKHGMHVAGTGHRIVAPDELAGDPPAHVLVMNPVYEREIGAMLARLGVKATVHVV